MPMPPKKAARRICHRGCGEIVNDCNPITMRASVIFTLVFTAIAGAIFLTGCGGKYHNWWEHYRPESKDPYGTFLVRNLLESYYPGEPFEVLEDSLGSLQKGGNYVFVGPWFWLDSAQTVALLQFVRQGNRALIACPNIPPALLDSIDQNQCLDFSLYDDSLYFADADFYFEDTTVTLNFDHPNLLDEQGYPYRFILNYLPDTYSWSYFPEEFFCEGQTIFASLGHIDGEEANFVKANYGSGAFYFHTIPLTFTNLYLTEKRGLEYAAKVFSHLSPGPIYWDQRDRDWYNPPRNRSLANESPLRYVLSQPSLAWAWYILLGMAVSYLLFRAKRRQRIIPVLEQNTNTSLEFIGTIGRLFFLQNNHKQLALQKMKLFLGFVRDRYHLPTRDLDEAFAKNLAFRSEMPEQEISKMLTLHRNISSSNYVSENVLVDFHQIIERFYRECK